MTTLGRIMPDYEDRRREGSEGRGRVRLVNVNRP